ncbi:hypothetical protein AB0N24_07200 [Arthrobacter sp. NPDC093128]|uniref:hypothetical protein n=1 Tax=Arthrobacter sp. NPDC093128 TaxID=3154979 RepID=UPI00344663F0
MSEIRRFNAAGLSAARDLLQQMQGGATTDIDALLSSPHYTHLISKNIDYEVRPFSDRQEAAEFFHLLLEPLTEDHPALEYDDGLWTWLSLKWIDILAPVDPKSGVRMIRRADRYILRPNDYQTYYRHYLSGPYRIYKAHLDDIASVRAVLANPVNQPGEVVEQLASKQDIISNRTLMGVATRLYVDPNTNNLKTGSRSKGGGSPRRLADVLYQLDQTWDTGAMSADEVISLLPKEFDRFKAS